ncbi:hypothetical protein DDE05_40575 [Streptomyces cavourensis]|nr:hypothetical protein DDE05_40575 [Streptomyces cavourensis]
MLPPHVIETIASKLKHADYSALRNSSDRLRKILPSLTEIRTMLPAPTRFRAEQFYVRLNQEFIHNLEESRHLAAILRTVSVEASEEHGNHKLELTFRYESNDMSGDEVFTKPVVELNKRGGFGRCLGGSIELLDVGPGEFFELYTCITIDKQNLRPALNMIYGTANEIWIEKNSNSETLILASLMYASMDAFLEKKADKDMMDSLRESYSGMFQAGRLMQKKFGART